MEASLLILFQMSRSGNLLRFVVVVLIFPMQVTYTMACLIFLLVLDFTKG